MSDISTFANTVGDWQTFGSMKPEVSEQPY
jgi:hypothetical protein